jgi:hypothetical protein
MAKNKDKSRKTRNKTMWDTARERPIAAAAAATAAGAAGVFLWSRRAQISEQVGQLSEQLGEWTETMRANLTNKDLELAETGAPETGAGRTTTKTKG